MARSHVFFLGVSMVALVACGSDVGRSNPTVDSRPVPVDTEVPAPVDTEVPASSPADAGEPRVDQLSLRYGTLTERSLGIDADGRTMTAAVAGMNDFAVDLYTAVASDESGNVVVSPYSVTFTLGMIYAGAKGDTATEMADVLHVDDTAEWQEGINAYDLTLDARTAGSPTTWGAANKVWTKPGLALRDDYLDVLTGVYGSPLAEADFAANADGERKVVNTWVDENTTGLIPELFPEGSFDPATAMVLVNAVALDAPWEFPFDPASTSDRTFTRPDGSTVSVPTMRYDEFLPSAYTEEYQAVELPYGGGALSMVVVMPNNLAAFEANLTAESLAEVFDSITDGGIHLSIPKWSARTHVTLNDTLATLGMPTAFGGGADFSGMVDGGGIWLDRVEHEAFIEVDEEGTRAAAATGGAMLGSHGPTVAIDQPFLYVIRDRGSGTVLFIGRVTDPSVIP